MSDLTPPTSRPSSLPQVSRLLVPVDFSPAGRMAARTAAGIARKQGAKITLLHVLTPVTHGPETVIHGENFQAKRRACALAELESLKDSLAEGTDVSCALREGSPFEEIIRFARSHKTGLIVLPRTRQPGLLSQLLGSTVERVVHEAPCAVLVLAGPEILWLDEPQHVLLTTDFSPDSLAAFPWAEKVACTYGARVTLTHVQVPMGLPGTREYARYHDSIDELRQAADAMLISFRQRHLSPAVEVDTRVVEGTPHRAINRLARRLSVSLIIIAAHGVKGWHHMLTGSTAQRVVRHATCAVLVVMPQSPVSSQAA
ncbi:universal stress protein [Prosthecobacter sp. SYSU 5D2]|uniref:universal stress protein n=1 Tax=Prosthecobacter sp. SYSU 5D2 TaxID=3134134 RepID=UPI0031FEB917